MLAYRVGRWLSVLAAVAACAVLVPVAAGAQQQPSHIAVGYVANVPDQLLGVGAHVLPGGFFGLGIYVDAKRGTDSPRDRRGFTESITVEQADEFGDQLFRTDAFSQSLNAALIRGFGRELLVYAGAGIVQEDVFREYLDISSQRGIGGIYTVQDGGASGSAVNLLGGVYFRLGSRVWVQMGGESRPRGFTIGGSYAIPLR